MAKRLKDDLSARLLRAAGNPEEHDKILQDESRRRAAKKLAATLSCPGFRFPTLLSAEQCTGDDLAMMHSAMVPEGAEVVDLTCGLGIDAFHIARKAKRVVAIDIDPAVASAIDPNAAALGLHNVTGVNADCRDWLASNRERFDVAFIDPARRGEGGKRLFSLRDCHPDVIGLLPEISRIAPRLIVKMSPMLDITRVLEELPGIRRLHVLGTVSECKELVADVEFGFSGEPEIVVETAGKPTLRFRPSERKAPTEYAADIEPGMTVGEPYPAVMKADPRGLLPGRQLAPSTRVWADIPADFPGRRYVVTAVEPFSSSNIKRLAKSGIKASVATRNFPLTADALRAKLKASEDSGCRLLGVTLNSGKRTLIFMRPE